MLGRLLWHVGVKGEGGYRPAFWRFALPLLLRGKLEPMLHYSLMAHHLIVFARDVCAGRQNASHYSTRVRDAQPVLEASE